MTLGVNNVMTLSVNNVMTSSVQKVVTHNKKGLNLHYHYCARCSTNMADFQLGRRIHGIPVSTNKCLFQLSRMGHAGNGKVSRLANTKQDCPRSRHVCESGKCFTDVFR